MSIPITCVTCERSFQVKDKYAGKIGSCPFCSGTIRVPRLAPPPPPPPPPEDDYGVLADDDEVSLCGAGSSAGRSLTNTVQIVTCSCCGRRNLGGMPTCVGCGNPLEE